MLDEQVITWAQNIGYQNPVPDWQTLWENVRHFKSATYKENGYNVFYKLYLSPSELAKIYNCLNICWKCQNKEKYLFHSWWTHSKAKKNLANGEKLYIESYWGGLRV